MPLFGKGPKLLCRLLKFVNNSMSTRGRIFSAEGRKN